MDVPKLKCRICNHNAERVAAGYKSYMEEVFFDIYHCSNCDTNFVDITNSDPTYIYNYIYSQADKIPGYNRYYYYKSVIKDQPDPLDFLSNKEAIYWAVKESILKYKITKQNSLLEVGTGLGYLSYALGAQGYNVKGIDISEDAIKHAKESLGGNYEVADIYKIEGEEMYDFIILNEVIEHVVNPSSFISTLIKLLKPNGKLLVTTPNKSVSIKGCAWDTDLPPVHLWWFSYQSMKYMAEQMSVNIDFLDFSEFNKKHFDKMRFKIYSPYKMYPSLNKKGEVINPQIYQPANNNIKSKLQKAVNSITNIKLFNQLLTRKDYPINSNSTLACVLIKMPTA